MEELALQFNMINLAVMKWIIRIVVLLVVLLIVGAGALYLSLNSIVKSVIEKQGSEQLNVPTTLSSVSLGLLKGTVDLNTLAIASPPGFSAPQMFSIGKLSVDTGGVSRLRDEPIHIATIDIDAPNLVVEQNNLKLNFRELMNHIPSSGGGGTTTTTADGKPAKKLIIDSLNITNAHVMLEPGIPGMGKEMDVALPPMTMEKIGNADGNNSGVAIKDVLLAVITKMVAQTTHSKDVPVAVQTLLSGNLTDVQGKLTDEAKKQLDKLKLPAGLNGTAGDAASGLLNNAFKAVGK